MSIFTDKSWIVFLLDIIMVLFIAVAAFPSKRSWQKIVMFVYNSIAVCVAMFFVVLYFGTNHIIGLVVAVLLFALGMVIIFASRRKAKEVDKKIMNNVDSKSKNNIYAIHETTDKRYAFVLRDKDGNSPVKGVYSYETQEETADAVEQARLCCQKQSISDLTAEYVPYQPAPYIAIDCDKMQYFFRFIGKDGMDVAVSEHFDKKEDCIAAAKQIMNTWASAKSFTSEDPIDGRLFSPYIPVVFMKPTVPAEPEISLPEPIEEPVSEPVETAEENAEEAPVEIAEENAEEAPAETAEENAEETPAETAEENTEETPAETAEENAEETPAETAEENAEEAPAETAEENAEEESDETAGDDSDEESGLASLDELIAAEGGQSPEDEGWDVIDTEEEPEVYFDENDQSYKQITFNKSFYAKMCLASQKARDTYVELKNEIHSYAAKGKKIRDRISWKYENITASKRTKLLRFSVRGKTLCVYFAIDPSEFEGTKYKVENVSGVKAYADYPSLYRVFNNKRRKLVKEMIAMLMEKNGFTQNNTLSIDYSDAFSTVYTHDELLEQGKIRKVISTWPNGGFSAK